MHKLLMELRLLKIIQIPDAVNNNEPLTRGQLVNTTALAGSNADLVRGLPADFTSSKAANGYQKLPSGVIKQWGYISQLANCTQTTFNFPIAFPNANVAVIVSGGEANNGSSDANNTVLNRTTTSFDFENWNGVTTNFTWIAIGY